MAQYEQLNLFDVDSYTNLQPAVDSINLVSKKSEHHKQCHGVQIELQLPYEEEELTDDLRINRTDLTPKEAPQPPILGEPEFSKFRNPGGLKGDKLGLKKPIKTVPLILS
jgi:hypothetical protein